jgi:predicted RNA-binding Zn-ribbon protein involved in translation (DUF1610 family)
MAPLRSPSASRSSPRRYSTRQAFHVPSRSQKPVNQADRGNRTGWKSIGLRAHICRMASGIWTTEHFTCPDCGMPYTATREEHPDKHSGSFMCRVCGGEVHAWSGVYDFFDWKTDKAKPPVFGKKK